jgi:hypothetical protein
MNVSVGCVISLVVVFGAYLALPLRVPAQSAKYAKLTQSEAFGHARIPPNIRGFRLCHPKLF